MAVPPAVGMTVSAASPSQDPQRVLERRKRREWNEHWHYHQEDRAEPCPVCHGRPTDAPATMQDVMADLGQAGLF